MLTDLSASGILDLEVRFVRKTTMASLPEKARAKILEVIFKYLSPREWDVYLFGSFAHGTADVGSDVDLAVRGPCSLPAAVAARIVADLEDEVPLLREFDLIDLNQVQRELREKATQEGIRWNRATPEQRDSTVI